LSPVSFATHPHIRNKPPAWCADFGSSWETHTGLTLDDLKEHVSGGGAFVAAAMSSHHRTSAAFVHADLAVVDIDSGLTLEEFANHPLAAQAAWVYTSASHAPDKHRFRVIFRLPERVHNPDLYKTIVTILGRALGGDRSCTDCCRLFYGFDGCEHPLWQPEVTLPHSILDEAEAVAEKQRRLYDRETAAVDEHSILKAIYVLEHVIEPTVDGQRDHFIRVTAAARAGGDALFPAWSDWASRCHHGSGSRSRQSTERFFQGMRGSSLGSLFFFANETDPDWRSKLPDELKGGGESSRGRSATWAGYSHEDFLGDPTVPPSPEAAYGLFSDTSPWAVVVKPAEAANNENEPPSPAAPVAASGYEDSDFEGAEEPKRAPGRPKKVKDDPTRIIMDRLKALLPGLRLNTVSQELEYGPKDRPCPVEDASAVYLRISLDTGAIFPKTAVNDLMASIAHENRYHPVRAYLESCAANAEPCPYFDSIGSTLLGLGDDPFENPKMPTGQSLGDLVMRRVMIAAVARVLNPGCDMDWMPILVGPQNSGKSAFFRYLVPDPSEVNGRWAVTLQQGISYIKDRPHVLHCGWIVVLDEIERYFQRRYVEELKNLVSVPSDRSARKYENERTFERSFVLAGATNSTDFLRDPTGNRRFMPITVHGKVPSVQDPSIKIIDLDRLKRDRDSLWCAAYQAHLAGESHLFTSYEIQWIEEYVHSFNADSPIEKAVLDEVGRNRSGQHKGRSFIYLSDLMKWMKIPTERQPSMSIEVTDVLKKHGWTLKRTTILGQTRRVWLAPAAAGGF
jgi:predicted P-loop ATPase